MTYRCPACRTRRATFTSLLAHLQSSGHRLCDCGAYHYPHRPFGGYCYKHEMSGARNAARYTDLPSDELQDIACEIAFTTKGRPGKGCPF